MFWDVPWTVIVREEPPCITLRVYSSVASPFHSFCVSAGQVTLS